MSTIAQPLVTELTDAARDVFETMVAAEVGSVGPIEGSALRPGTNVVGTVAFAGSTSGLVAFYTTLDSARALTASMLGIPVETVNGELPDAIGELTNMIAGSFRTRMAHAGEPRWAISIPSVTIGSDFYTKYVSDVDRVLCPFVVSGHEVFVELIVTREDA
jgi:chemotaxis protein CheX